MYDDCTVLLYGCEAKKITSRIIHALEVIGCSNVIEAVEGWAWRPKVDMIVLISYGDANTHVVDMHLSHVNTYIPVVVIDMSQTPGSHIRYVHAGANDVIPVGCSDEELNSRLANVLNSRLWVTRIESERDAMENEIRRWVRMHDETRIEITRRLGRAAEFRDNETGRHVIRVSNFSHTIASALGLPSEEINLITHASPLHDIGKIGVPDGILLKPGPLTTEEWRVMKRHTVIGARILDGSDDPLMHTAREISMGHHEHWDGSGYPRRRTGNKIPLSARVVAVADVFDALTSERPYKQPWPHLDAMNYIKQQSGKQFDPDVVNVFVAENATVMDICRTYAEPETQRKACAMKIWRTPVDETPEVPYQIYPLFESE